MLHRNQVAFKAAKQERIGKFNIVGYIRSTKQFINLDHGQGKGALLVDALRMQFKL